MRFSDIKTGDELAFVGRHSATKVIVVDGDQLYTKPSWSRNSLYTPKSGQSGTHVKVRFPASRTNAEDVEDGVMLRQLRSTWAQYQLDLVQAKADQLEGDRLREERRIETAAKVDELKARIAALGLYASIYGDSYGQIKITLSSDVFEALLDKASA